MLVELLLVIRPSGGGALLEPRGYLPQRVNLVPFETIRLYMRVAGYVGYLNNIGNVLAFLPLGCFYRCFARRRRTAVLCVLLTALVSLAFECLQLLLQVGSFDVDDVILNALGGFLGYAATALAGWFRRKRARRGNRSLPGARTGRQAI
jgi:glycopeptide antibiotics resistance protein